MGQHIATATIIKDPTGCYLSGATIAAIEAGEIRSDVDLEIIMASIGGMVIGCQLNGTVDQEGWIDDVMKLVWNAVKAQ